MIYDMLSAAFQRTVYRLHVVRPRKVLDYERDISRSSRRTSYCIWCEPRCQHSAILENAETYMSH